MFALMALLLVWTLTVAKADTPKSSVQPDPKVGRCTVKVDGSTVGSEHCEYDIADDGSFELWPTPPFNYYVMVDVAKGGSASGYDHEKGDLGKLKKQGACWVNKRARICLWQK
jgi:hypothetical protein